MPVVKKITKATILARFSRTLAMLLKSGVNIDEAMDIVKTTIGNYHFEKALSQISKSVGQGVKLSHGLAKYNEFFPVLMTKMIGVGEESGRFEETLFYLADFYELEVDSATKSLSTILEPVLLMFIGLAVAFLALSIITPIYEITGNIRR